MKIQRPLAFIQLSALLRVALGNTEEPILNSENIDWSEIYKESQKQCVVGIAFAGILKIKHNIPKRILLNWYMVSEHIKQGNEKIYQRCVDLQKQCHEAGLRSAVLKGAGVGSLYGNLSLLRVSGDIDLWVDADWRGVMDYVNSISPNTEFDSKHTHLYQWKDTIVEMHWRPAVNKNPLYKRALDKYFQYEVDGQCRNSIVLKADDREYVITAPIAKFNVIYVLHHIYGHFLYEGVGLRQIMDYYFVLKSFIDSECCQGDYRPEVIQRMRDFGLYGFSRALMFVLKEVFGLEDRYLITKPDKALGDVLLQEIIEGGNFGHSAKENQVYNEGFMHRMMRRVQRRARLLRYNALGTLCAPIYKISFLMWKRKVIQKYNLLK